jgi:hypothetical protein
VDTGSTGGGSHRSAPGAALHAHPRGLTTHRGRVSSGHCTVAWTAAALAMTHATIAAECQGFLSIGELLQPAGDATRHA